MAEEVEAGLLEGVVQPKAAWKPKTTESKS